MNKGFASDNFISKVVGDQFAEHKVDKVFILFGSKSLISLSFPLLFVPISNLLIFLICI